jgi:outer membrane receptor protein involved in Fe transport
LNKKISAAVFAALASQGQNAVAQSEDTLSLEEVVVTAQRRSENIQNVPITVQALTTETLENLKVSTIDEFVKFLPNVQSTSVGPTHGNFSIRGLSLGAAILQGGGTVGQWPTVGLYLDDQAVQMPGRNLDVYAADLERIEVSKARRARCSVPAPRRAWSATSPTSPSTTPPKPTSAPATA